MFLYLHLVLLYNISYGIKSLSCSPYIYYNNNILAKAMSKNVFIFLIFSLTLRKGIYRSYQSSISMLSKLRTKLYENK